MKFNLESLFNIDRRIIFVFIFFSVLIPFLIDFKLDIKPSKNVIRVYDKIEEVGRKGDGTIFLSFDFDNASKAELEPMARAMVKHIFSRNIKLVASGNWPNGVEMTKQILSEIATKMGKVHGEDWTYLGHRPGAQILIISMGNDLHKAFPTDARGQDVTTMSVTRNMRKLNDFDYVVSLSAGNGGIEEWVVYGQSKFGFTLGGACTAVMAPDFFPYLQSGQLYGMIGGLVGAAQYEVLIKSPGSASKGMNALSVSHIVLVLFIIFGNICYFLDKFLKRRGEV